MKTTKEQIDLVQSQVDLGYWTEDYKTANAVVEAFPAILFDLSRLAAIEEARAKGGLTSGERAIVPETQGIIIRLDDALRAANEENERLRAMLLDYDLHLGNAMSWVAHFKDESADVQRRLVDEHRAKCRAYLAEVEARDGK